MLLLWEILISVSAFIVVPKGSSVPKGEAEIKVFFAL